MRIAVWPADQHGCGHYRLIYPQRALAAQGADVVIDPIGPVCEWSRNWEGHTIPPDWTDIVRVRPYEADVVVMQRPAQRHKAQIIPHLQRQGIRVVVDVDDLFDAIPKANAAWADYQPGGRYASVAHGWIDAACRIADVVTCSAQPLLRRYGYGHGVVLPNLVPEAYLSIETFHWRNLIGWSGIAATHIGDLEATEGAIASVLRRNDDWEFHNVGPDAGVAKGLQFEGDVSSTGFLAFESWAASVAELDVGIVPLASNLFNEAKSALKVSEMASVGVPVVMSPTPDNLRLHRLGVGLVAESRGQWGRQVGKLVSSDELRADLAGRGKEVMSAQTYEAHAGRWLAAWQQPAKEIAA